MAETVTVKTVIDAPAEKVWEFYTLPKHIVKWNCASDDWHTPRAENDVKVGGKFMSRMEARDGSAGFDFEGIYTAVKLNELLAYTMGDGRKVTIIFSEKDSKTTMVITFDPENENSIEMQKQGWQSILDNFKKYAESN